MLSFSFLNGPIGFAYHIVFSLAQLLSPLGIGLATAAAIVLFTVAVRLLLSPLSYHAYRGQARMSALQPKIAELRKQYGSQPERLQAELTALYRAEGGGMLAGCLPLLLQLPFFTVLYRLFLSSTVDGGTNHLLTRELLGTPLGSHWLTGAGALSMHGLLFIGLFLLLAAVAFVMARATGQLGASPAAAGPAAVSTRAAGTGAAGTGAAGTGAASTGAVGAGAAQPAGLGLLGKLLPYSTVAIAAFVPLAAGIYLLTTTAWTAAERLVLRRLVPQPPSAQPPAGQPPSDQPPSDQPPSVQPSPRATRTPSNRPPLRHSSFVKCALAPVSSWFERTERMKSGI